MADEHKNRNYPLRLEDAQWKQVDQLRGKRSKSELFRRLIAIGTQLGKAGVWPEDGKVRRPPIKYLG